MLERNTLRTIRSVYRSALCALYSQDEIDIIFKWLALERMQLAAIVFQHHLDTPLELAIENELNNDLDQLILGRPVQYVLGYADFFGSRFTVREACLIPRPETEELVARVIAKAIETGGELVLLDVGTGSGCIGLSLAKALPNSTVHCLDVSDAALQIAKENAEALGIRNVVFHELDFLNPITWATLPTVDWVVSNPPYIPQGDRIAMHPNVIDFEPDLALFVPDADLLVFYKALVDFCLTSGAHYLLAEIYEKATPELSTTIKVPFSVLKDLQGKDRFIEVVINTTVHK